MANKNNNRVILGAVAAGLMAVSLPLTWLTIHTGEIEFKGGPFGGGGQSLPMPSLPGMQLVVTGLNGSITVGAQLPIWLLVVAAIGGTIVAMLNELRISSVPPVWMLVDLVAVGVFFARALGGVLSGGATMGIGYLLAIAGLAIAIALVVTQMGKHRAPNDQGEKAEVKS